ncbi:MAG: Efflux transporter, family, subunit [Deltaproteobacteria bacterium]|nr:Efflux transporter, family, subunit [Deltaproteobacteria bacterium]
MRRWFLRIAMVLALAAVVAAVIYAYRPRPALVDVAQVTAGRLVVSLDAEGKVRVRERYVVLAPIAGISSRIELDPGDAVAEGAELARIQPTLSPLLDPQSRSVAEARLRAAEDARSQAQAAVARTSAALELARSELQRTKTLAERGAATGQQLELATFEVRTGEASVQAAQSALRVAGHEIESARATLERLAPGRKERDAFAVTAPIAGQVLRVMRESEGAVVPGTPLLELGDLSAIEIVADVLTRDAAPLRRGITVLVTEWGTEKERPGRVRRIEPAAFTRISPLGVEEQRVNVLIDFERPVDAAFGDGYAVDVRFMLSDDPKVRQVAASALFRHAEGWAAFVVQDGKASLRTVKVGKRNPMQAEVLEGLADGETVVVHPGELVRDGSRVEAR